MKQTAVSYNSSIKRTPMGEAKRAMVRSEVGFYPTFEALLQLHRLDFWHNYSAQRSQPGWPDYTVFGDGWHAWVELKARNPVTGRRGKVSTEQLRYKETIEQGGGEWVTFLLPDEWHSVDLWLNERTNRNIWGSWA